MMSQAPTPTGTYVEEWRLYLGRSNVTPTASRSGALDPIFDSSTIQVRNMKTICLFVRRLMD